jgi:RNA-directed DNA polymerase
MDRVIQQAVAQVLMPIFGPSFSASSFGFRPGRNAQPVVQGTGLHGQKEEGKSFV